MLVPEPKTATLIGRDGRGHGFEKVEDVSHRCAHENAMGMLTVRDIFRGIC